MLVGKEEPLCTFCVWPWPSCVCVCVGDVPHTPALSTLCVERLLRESWTSRANYSAFSQFSESSLFCAVPLDLRVNNTPSGCRRHATHAYTHVTARTSRHTSQVPGVCVITINNACNGSTVHTRAVRRRYLEVLPLLLHPRAVPRLLRMPYLLVPNVQQFWHFPYSIVIQDFT
jgi:hypothetical protein